MDGINKSEAKLKDTGGQCHDILTRRAVLEAVVGSLIIGLLSGITGYLAEGGGPNMLVGYGTVAFLLSFSIWTSNMAISNWALIKYPRNEQTVKRLLIQTSLNTLVAFVIVLSVIVINVLVSQGIRDSFDYYSTIIFTIIITLLINAVYVGRYFFSQWRAGLLREKELQIAHQTAQLEALRGQMDPHFLFNALTTLSELIHEDQQKASHYVEELSRVYRYILDHNKSTLIALSDELNFLKSYIYLLETKYGPVLKIQWPADAGHIDANIPVLASQIAIENIVKHNIINRRHPMPIDIYVEGDALVIKNLLNPKPLTSVLSHGMGLQNLEKRYQLLVGKTPNIKKDEECFTIELPLINE